MDITSTYPSPTQHMVQAWVAVYTMKTSKWFTGRMLSDVSFIVICKCNKQYTSHSQLTWHSIKVRAYIPHTDAYYSRGYEFVLGMVVELIVCNVGWVIVDNMVIVVSRLLCLDCCQNALCMLITISWLTCAYLTWFRYNPFPN